MKNLVLLRDPASALVFVDIALLHGSARDPEGKEGTASLTMSMLMRGTKKRPAKQFHEALDLLGGEIHMGKFKDSMRLYGVVLAKKLDPFMDLVEEMLLEPSFSEEEFAKIKAQFRGALVDELGSDDDIVDRRFQEYMLWGNVYGRMTSGSIASIDNITVQDLRAFHATYFTKDSFIAGAAGGFDAKRFPARLKKIISSFGGKKPAVKPAPAPLLKKGKSLLILDKPERSQSHIVVGSSGVSYFDENYLPMVLANHVFGGGSFSSRLMKEVREKRGWSYGAYSWFRSGRQPLYFAMSAVPANKDTVPALRLMVKLFHDFSKKGVTKAEFDFAKQSLVSQSAFLQDTLRKRLDNKISEQVLGMKAGFYDRYRKNLAAITHGKVQRCVRKYMDSGKIFAVVLGTAEALERDLPALKGFKLWKQRFDAPPSDPYKLPQMKF